MSDGPLGVRQDKPSTRYPAGIALAASWNRDLAQLEGVSMARDCRAAGYMFCWLRESISIACQYVVEISNISPAKIPIWLRNWWCHSFAGFRARGSPQPLKHFAANNQEINRQSINVMVTERALREIYLPAFEAAVRIAKVGAVMDAYNKVNGDYCTENGFLNNVLLKREWGFEGVLMSDWGATHSALGPAREGLDLEMPSGTWMSAGEFVASDSKRRVTQEQIDDKVRRILRMIVRMGYLDRPQLDSSIPENDPESGKAALAIAEEGIVLLKNEKNLLPLDRAKIKSIAVLGPDAHPGVPAGWGSSYVIPYYAVSVLDGLTEQQRIGNKGRLLRSWGR